MNSMFRYVFIFTAFVFTGSHLAAASELSQQELDQSLAKWRQANSDEYIYEFQRSCFCFGDIIRKAWVHVADNDVVDVIDVETRERLSSPSFVTVDELFEQLQESIDRPAASIRATFDSSWGYPSEVYIDLDEMMADEEVSYRTGSLVQLPPACDVTTDRTCGGPLIDTLGDAIRTGIAHPRLDANQDGSVNTTDVDHLVEVQMGTYFGDANLDGRFDSTDFLRVFQAGQYDDAIAGNSTWATGDWNGSRDFDAADLILALQRGGYLQAPRSSVMAVPEPRVWGAAFLGCLSIVSLRRRYS